MSVTPQPWGKCQSDGTRHPLVDHCLDVAMVFTKLIEARPRSPLGDLSEGQRQRLAVIAFLHDFGKCNRGFQNKINPQAKNTAGHVMEAVALLDLLKKFWPPEWKRLITDILSWFQDKDQAAQILLASISHHGRPVSYNDYEASGVDRSAKELWSPADGYDPMAALDDLAIAARRAFPRAFDADVPPIAATPGLQQRFAGLVMLADWIGSDTQFFPYRQSEEEDRLAFAARAAERALRAIGLIPPESRRPRPFNAIFGFSPTPLQAALAGAIPLTDETRLLLMEADTGSGKTEAALAWFFRLYAECKVNGLYFALPTRVAAREIYERVRRSIEAAFEANERPSPVLLAAPGYVKIDGRAVHEVLANPHGILWDDNAKDLRREQMWSAERPKRFLAAPIAVGTIDQALLSVLKVKHSLMRSVCLDRHLLVVDEVHASDPYMQEVLCELLRGHLLRGGWALLLSATLGEAAAARYFDRHAVPLAEAIERPYPLLSGRSQTWTMPATRERSIEIELSPTLEDDAALVPRLIAALDAGARIFVVCNTVKRANALFRQVESALEAERTGLLPALFALDGVRCPHHGRFAREDRERLDAAITMQLGKDSPEGARLVIGTQTLEQSLDIDADWLITDLAPMDVLIQRFGRLHRHDRPRRAAGFETPRALIRVPTKDLAEYLDKEASLRAPAGLGVVYPDGRVLALTWQVLREHRILYLPEEARAYIEKTTHPEAFAQLPPLWEIHGQNLQGKELSRIRQALRSVLDDRPFGELHYEDKGEHILTRLGEPTYEIPLDPRMCSPFGVPIERMTIPSRWLKESALPETIRAEADAEGLRFAIGKANFCYTRFGVEKDDA